MFKLNRSLNFKILETEDNLKLLFINEKDTRKRERLQAIYLLKIGEIKRITKLSKVLGKDRTTIGNWFRKYEKSGLDGLLERKTSLGRPSAINKENLAKLKNKLSQSEGFKSYSHIKVWILEELGIEMKYKAVFRLCHQVLHASPKVSRPKNPKQNIEDVEAFKKKL